MSEANKSQNTLVSIVMGSASDWEIMQPAHQVLQEFGIESKVEVISAHRMPEDMVDYAKSAASNGFKVIIAGAGGSAHLPGMIASLTTLPVIGVPVPLRQLEGLDSLLSIVQMPAGVPVATVGVGNAKNAGLLAARIISTDNDNFSIKVRNQLDRFQQNLRVEAIDKGDSLIARIKNLVSPIK